MRDWLTGTATIVVFFIALWLFTMKKPRDTEKCGLCNGKGHRINDIGEIERCPVCSGTGYQQM